MNPNCFLQHDYQQQLDEYREKYQFDFAGIALPDNNDVDGVPVIKWRYVSGNINDRYKRIILRNGKGLAGNVMKTGKEFIVPDVSESLFSNQLFNYPILVSEALTAVVVLPLWFENKVCGVLLYGQREGNHLPHYGEIDKLRTGIGAYSCKDRGVL
ncbi:nitrate respiration regulation accessory nitrate sensor NreA [Staphylococcus massiliensis]|uniref:Nitrogen regulation-related NreA protein n=1 Tax=Staphylococcus massiliensis S46 TaxID=1229783 RepID=K9AZ44_9STAP|nr:nitrate respiration regulation accessory nitrate sensor NreA [Staphylococcus massiliensis]EKU46785.1 nitrogen regulation-related NreA protein [Staphylococcus massiliensis S46]MCG3399300.1 nitrate respiration regulation accessory nitrate sensor NreA [Staphylococcus massiliensis]MCG3402371.1 nitrate respiration regulation accessory nitrate sensor NreA [Staphylococcus massiliensis]MCG3411663.1 nitrate respiration regulation accessory nitrate sensor NreA [Staphylococcus massiliensis]POA01390.1 